MLKFNVSIKKGFRIFKISVCVYIYDFVMREWIDEWDLLIKYYNKNKGKGFKTGFFSSIGMHR